MMVRRTSPGECRRVGVNTFKGCLDVVGVDLTRRRLFGNMREERGDKAGTFVQDEWFQETQDSPKPKTKQETISVFTVLLTKEPDLITRV